MSSPTLLPRVNRPNLEHSAVLIESYLNLMAYINTYRIKKGEEYVEKMFPHWADLEAEFYNSVMHLLKDADPPLADMFDKMVYYEYYIDQKKKEVSNEG